MVKRSNFLWLALAGVVCVDATESANATNGTIPEVVLPDWEVVTSQDEDVDAAERLDVLNETWTTPFRVLNCPVQQTSNVTAAEGGGIQISTPYGTGKLYTLVESSLSGSDLAKYDGIEMHFTTSGLTQFKIRIQDDAAGMMTRFIAAIGVDGDGLHTLWLKWSDFHGEKMERAGIDPCTLEDSCGGVAPEAISALGLLLPIPDNETWSGSFTLHSLTADILARATTSMGQTGSPNSARVKPSSDAEAVNFADEEFSVAASAHSNYGCTFWRLACSFMYLTLTCIFLD
eukprot:CAMPEP_0197651520 /NCGR_PEP_ID=MMETSP1338-20131121/32938_1 /TAXON_ID=43686 ORGANISM="Pelagodinium beii, Strain RCC1491" /NCGR_SAMPLE_ID=MMETSP1338 /ASSEMBLY_ACC=CAM_ASM_000754 /LENGTH=287 /DNA_ID=CAMNT_0043226181 /DNA_START=55 /DNA_END=918 /DNA_ORIENTATION=+